MIFSRFFHGLFSEHFFCKNEVQDKWTCRIVHYLTITVSFSGDHKQTRGKILAFLYVIMVLLKPLLPKWWLKMLNLPLKVFIWNKMIDYQSNVFNSRNWFIYFRYLYHSINMHLSKNKIFKSELTIRRFCLVEGQNR